MHIIPAIDLIDGKCVRLTQGDYQQVKIYHESPVEMALELEQSGVKKLHLVDLDGAKAGRVINFPVLKAITKATKLEVDFGGGIKAESDLEKIFEAGAKQVTIGTLAVKQPAKVAAWIKKYGPERIIIGADVKAGKIAISGWQEKSDWGIHELLSHYIPLGLKYVMCTDVSKDGKLQGSAIPLYGEIRSAFPDIQLIASGGISSTEELDTLEAMGCYGSIVGKALYEGLFAIEKGRWIETQNQA